MIVVMNRSAGGPDDPAERIVELFRSHGDEPRIFHADASHDIATVAREAAQTGEPIVVGAGGDGTISAVAAALAGTDKVLGVLPVGTLNISQRTSESPSTWTARYGRSKRDTLPL
jgi:diacylglycerol kinase (ATP)